MKTKIIMVFGLILLLSGCSKKQIYWRMPWSSEPPVIIHAVEESHILEVPPGAWIEWDDMSLIGPDGKEIDVPGDKFYVEHWGNFISNQILDEVAQAHIKRRQ